MKQNHLHSPNVCPDCSESELDNPDVHDIVEGLVSKFFEISEKLSDKGTPLSPFASSVALSAAAAEIATAIHDEMVEQYGPSAPDGETFRTSINRMIYDYTRAVMEFDGNVDLDDFPDSDSPQGSTVQ